MRMLGLEELIGDPRWTCFKDTIDKADILTPILDEAFARVDRDDILRQMQEHDIAASAVLSSAEVCKDEQAIENRDLTSFKQCGKDMMIPSSPVKFGEMEPPPLDDGPELTEYAADILREYGYSDSEMEALRRDGVTEF